MKYRWDKKYLYWGVTAFVVLSVSILFFYGLLHVYEIKKFIDRVVTILMPIIYGFAIAYLLNPVVKSIENKCLFKICEKFNIKKTRKIRNVIRSISIFIAIALMLLLLYELLYMVIPQLITSISTMISKMPTYVDNSYKWIMKVVDDNPSFEKSFLTIVDYFVNYLTNDLLPQVNQILRQISTGVVGGFVEFVVVIKNLVIGLIVSIYLLNSKERFTAQGKKFLFAVLNVKHANLLIHNLRFTDHKFGGFIIGNLIDSFIIGIICFIFTYFMKTPYGVLISVIVGVTNVIPFFGPYIGAVPSAFLILLVDPIQCVYFIIFIIILQMIDGNIIAPRILSESTNLTSFWIIFAILIAGGLFGVIGMFLGVPLFAVIYAGISSLMNKSLSAKNLSTHTEDYMMPNDLETAEIKSGRGDKKNKKS